MHTSHGVWRVREGIIITLIDSEGQIAQGEIAPIPWFGSETIEQAIQFCQKQGQTISVESIKAISDNLPACQFGLESALLKINQQLLLVKEDYFNFCYLLPTGKKVLEQSYQSNNNHQPTFKWKIGVEKVATEIAILQQLIDKLPQNARLRLDANGGLTVTEAEKILEFTDNKEIIEFIEQPLPPSQFSDMMELTKRYSTCLALDESVANIRQLKSCYQKGWRGVFIIKPLIMGFPSHLRQFCQQHDLDLVFSSVFETSIGRYTALQLAWELGNHTRAIGFGVKHWFEDS